MAAAATLLPWQSALLDLTIQIAALIGSSAPCLDAEGAKRLVNQLRRALADLLPADCSHHFLRLDSITSLQEWKSAVLSSSHDHQDDEAVGVARRLQAGDEHPSPAAGDLADELVETQEFGDEGVGAQEDLKAPAAGTEDWGPAQNGQAAAREAGGGGMLAAKLPVDPKLLLEHLKTSEHSCSECGQKFNSLSRLKMHMRKKHRHNEYPMAGVSFGQGPLHCPIPACSYVTHSGSGTAGVLRVLQKHYNRKHKEQPQEWPY